MSNLLQGSTKMTNHRWTIVVMLFMATTVNYLDRQVLSLTWADFIAPEFHWTNSDYGTITGLFSIFYAVSMLFAGKFIDWLDTKKGFLWAIGVWSFGAIMHAFCGILTAGITAGEWTMSFHGAREAISTVGDVSLVVSVSVTLFVFARLVLAIGEAGNFPAAIKATAEYFPKKDRAYATSIFNSGAQIGALLAPLTIPFIAKAWGWEMAFIVIGALGFIWMGFWIFVYHKPEQSKKVNALELEYINQDDATDALEGRVKADGNAGKKVSFKQAFKYKQTWSFAVGKFLTDGVWWFLLFWIPAYLSSVYGLDSTESAPHVFVVYAISMISVFAAGYFPAYYMEKKKLDPYQGRMRAMLLFAFFPLLILFAQPLGGVSVWLPVIIIGIAAAAHQSWSANIFTTVSDMFPKHAVGTITGIGGMAGGVGSFFINKSSGVLFDHAANTNMKFLGYEGIESGYFIIFIFCAIAYLLGWTIMKALVPKYQLITDM
ncbi:MAG: MFS transporter [Proteiniphilum sp.]|nr:MFS transporter [Proteiniphilum sp.]MDD3555516.1 MFS transporter [Proteiniphilum sp.]MDD3980123.1 MFS transporter [Proteiniphilum sp.]MDD5346726.1 MFS transporter [Proteiniphilum sp.]MDD5620803.1 MFS transporter [Proteiniphilum sp.]